MPETLAGQATADFALRVAREFADATPRDLLDILFGKDDIADAYKRIPTCQPWFTVVCLADPVVCLADPASGESHFFIVPGHLFGLVSSVMNFNSVVEFTTFISTALMALVTRKYLDGVSICELADTAAFGQLRLRALHHKLGLPFSDEKHEEVDRLLKWLGAWTDLRRTASHGMMSIAADEARLRDCLLELTVAFADARLTPHQAESLVGKLSLLMLSQFDRLGRTALPALWRHASQASSRLSEASLPQIALLIRVLTDLEPFELPLRPPRELHPLI